MTNYSMPVIPGMVLKWKYLKCGKEGESTLSGLCKVTDTIESVADEMVSIMMDSHSLLSPSCSAGSDQIAVLSSRKIYQ